MLTEFRAHHARIAECLARHVELCSATSPEIGRLALSRLRLLNTTSDHSRFLAREVLPALQASDDPASREAGRYLAADLTARQGMRKAHIEKWDVQAIERDWAVYQPEALRILADLKRRLARDAEMLEPLLRRMEERDASPPF